MADIKGDAKKELFGQPLWVWGVAGAVMIAAGIYLYRRNAKAAAAAAATTPDSGTASSGTSSLYGWMLDQQASPAAGAATTTTATTTTPGTVTLPISGPPGVANTNAEPSYWTQAIEALKAKGVKNPTNKQIGTERNAIRKTVGLKPLPV